MWCFLINILLLQAPPLSVTIHLDFGERSSHVQATCDTRRSDSVSAREHRLIIYLDSLPFTGAV
jgi:hypothetical protein